MNTSRLTPSRCLLALVALSLVLFAGAFNGVTPGMAQAAAARTPRVFIPLVSKKLPLQLVNGDFEQGRAGWFESSIKNLVIIVDVTSDTYKNHKIPTKSGKWIAWLGGAYEENSSISQKVTINPERPYLTYWHFIASEDLCAAGDKDAARILVNSNVYTSYDLCKSTQTNGWQQKYIDLTAYAGQDITVAISVVTNKVGNSNLFIDDVSFTSGRPSTSAAAVEGVEEDSILAGLQKDMIDFSE